KGKNVPEPAPVSITGQEDFYVDDHYNLGIILYSGASKTKPTPVDGAVGKAAETSNGTPAGDANPAAEKQQSATGQMEIYDISLNDFADLIRL
ncbi:MAG: hypothetical protein VZR04_08430, partial [Succiniclasticum sp.]|nr:hypothetical protein [Succiniclasticum sp.]